MLKFLMTVLLGFSLSAVAGTTTNTATATKVQARKITVPTTNGIDVVLTVDNSIILDDVMCDEVTAKVAKKAKELDARLESNEPLILVLNTPGGCIDDGLSMNEVIKRLNRPVYTLTLFAASMGFQTVQYQGQRLITRDGTLMSHKARGGFYGEFPGQLDSRYGYYLKRVKRLDEQAVKRTNGKHTLASYHALIENEYWCDGQDCVDQGFADRVVTAKCDKSLDGNREESYKFFFRGARIVLTLMYDKCPLISGLLDYDITVDGNKLFKKKENSWDSDTDAGLTKEQLIELNDKVQQIIKDRGQRKVIKY